MSLDLKTLRKGDVVRGTGTWDGTAIRWDAHEYVLMQREFRAGDPVSWREEGRLRRGAVIALTPLDRAGQRLAWVEPYLGNPVTVATLKLSHEALPRRDEVEEAAKAEADHKPLHGSIQYFPA